MLAMVSKQFGIEPLETSWTLEPMLDKNMFKMN